MLYSANNDNIELWRKKTRNSFYGFRKDATERKMNCKMHMSHENDANEQE